MAFSGVSQIDLPLIFIDVFINTGRSYIDISLYKTSLVCPSSLIICGLDDLSRAHTDDSLLYQISDIISVANIYSWGWSDFVLNKTSKLVSRTTGDNGLQRARIFISLTISLIPGIVGSASNDL